MRLINTRTLRLERFFEVARIPPYAALSHTWGHDEVSFLDFQCEKTRERKHGYQKIKSACEQARKQGLDFAWVDTCCIDKTSSAELSEAINSMFKWYQRSETCYAFLEDVQEEFMEGSPSNTSNGESRSEFASCRWFTRGWTLQELIAPQRVDFYNRHWKRIGSKSSSPKLIEEITGIDAFVLEGAPPQDVNVGRRMSWAVDRQTRREEDMAYSLMGLFNINMPLIYGEGNKAFLRLQEEILRQSDDHTLFAWRAAPAASQDRGVAAGLLAPSPNAFRNFRSETRESPDNGYVSVPRDDLVRVWDDKAPKNPITMTNKGILITSRIIDLRAWWAPKEFIVLVLDCCPRGDMGRAAGIYLSRQDEDRYVRVKVDELADIRLNDGDLPTHTLHGIKTLGAEIQGHQYDKPWTTPYKIEKELLFCDSTEAVKQQYENAFYLEKHSLKVQTIFGKYLPYGVSITDSRKAWRYFRFDPYDARYDIVLKTDPYYRCVFLLRSARFADTISVILGVDEHPLRQRHWVNVVSMNEEYMITYGARISEIVSDVQSTHSIQGVAHLSEGLFEITVKVQPKVVDGIQMQAVEIDGPRLRYRHLGPKLLESAKSDYPMILIMLPFIATVVGIIDVFVYSVVSYREEAVSEGLDS